MLDQHFTSPALDKSTKEQMNKIYEELQALRRAIAHVARDCNSPIMMELAARLLDRGTATRIRRKTTNS